MFWRFMLSTGHGVYDILTKRLDKGGDHFWLILVVRISSDDTKKKPLKVIWHRDMTAIFHIRWMIRPRSGGHVLLDG